MASLRGPGASTLRRVGILIAVLAVVAAPAAALRGACFRDVCKPPPSSHVYVPFCSLRERTRDLVAAGFQQGRSPDVVERFAAELPRHLTPAGHALVVLSSDGEAPTFLRIFHRAGLSVDEVARRRHLNETLTIYRLRASGDCR